MSCAAPPLPAPLARTLRPYQVGGVDFLWRTTVLGMGGCLADDMGLGKTLQVLTYLELLRKRGLLSPLPALLIAPASLLENWKSEAAKFTPGLRLKLLHNSALVPGELDRFEADPAGFLAESDLAVTTYAMATRLRGLHALEFPAVVIDEAPGDPRIRTPARAGRSGGFAAGGGSRSPARRSKTA